MSICGLSRRRLRAAAIVALVACWPGGAALAQRSLLSDDDGGNGRSCMTDYMLRNFLADQGFTNVRLTVSHGRDWPAQGFKGGQQHLLTVDTCARQIYYRGGR